MSAPEPDAIPVVWPRRRNVALVVAVVGALYALILVYPPLRLAHLIAPHWQPGSLLLATIIVGPLLGRVVHEWWPNDVTRTLSAYAMGWLGMCFIAFLALIPAEIALLREKTQPQAMGVATLAAAALFSAWAFINAQWLRIHRLTLPGKRKARGRLVQISDVHIGSRSPRLLSRIVRKVNAQQPDIVVITGDFIDFRHIAEERLVALRELSAPTYFVIGNHERYVDLEAICQRLRRLGVRVLRNESHHEGDFHFLGIDDAEAKDRVARVLPSLSRDPSRYEVLLYHRPDGFEAAAAQGVDLMLCGHTHNGQIMPFNLLVKRVFPRIVGIHDLPGSTLYVSPGTGTWGPAMRLGTRSEITTIDIG